MSTQVEVLFSPAEVAALPGRDLSRSVCVVFDVLRATSTMVTALSNGAAGILPVAEITDALQLRRQKPSLLLAGERDGLRITATVSGGVEFDFGNSPREYTPDRVRNRTVIMTTTNGTRALRACAGAASVLIGAFLNLEATASHLRRHPPEHLLLVCSGTGDRMAYEDALCAGALCGLVRAEWPDADWADSAAAALQLHSMHGPALSDLRPFSSNARRLLNHSELRDDVAACLQRDTLAIVAALDRDGVARKLSNSNAAPVGGGG